MRITLRGQSKAERDATAIGTTRSIVPRTDLIGPGGQLTFVRPLLGNAAGPGRLPDAVWRNGRGDGKAK